MQEAVKSVETSFHNVDYVVSVSLLEQNTLSVEVESQEDTQRWAGIFTANYIEDITTKTGNFKKFPVFVRMLVAALKGESQAVFVDLLTYGDLEALKTRRAAAAGQTATPLLASNLPPSNKRYLILTYAAEFDRVHYPLPLQEAPSSAAHLAAVVRRLRSQLSQAQRPAGQHGNGKPQAGLQDEAQQLGLDSAARLVGPAQEGSNNWRQELAQLRNERDEWRKRAGAIQGQLESESSSAAETLQASRAEAESLRNQLEAARDQIRSLRQQCRDLTRLAATGLPYRTDTMRSWRDPRSSRAPSPYSRASAPGLPSRASSRDPSPLPSRSASPAHSRRSHASAHGDSLSQRAQSVPPARPRFDPTEFVRRRREQQELWHASSCRLPTPPPSRPTSARSSPVRSASIERLHSGQATSRRSASARLPPDPRGTRRDPADALSSDTSDGVWQRPRAPPRSQPRPAERAWHAQGLNGRHATAVRAADGGQAAGPQPQRRRAVEERATSPGRALREIQAKLSHHAMKQHHQHQQRPAQQPSEGMSENNAQGANMQRISKEHVGGCSAENVSFVLPMAGGFGEANADIAEIDARLLALQTFLKAAKAGAT